MMKSLAQFSIFTLFAAGGTQAQSSLNQSIRPLQKSQLRCIEGYFFDTSLYSCMKCGTDAIQDPEILTQCTCPDGFVKTAATVDDFNFDCEACPANQGPSQDKSTCMTCAGGASFNSNTKSCTCTEGFKLTELNTDGSSTNNQIICEKCPDASFALTSGPEAWKCTQCDHFAMVFDQNLKKCICDDSQGYQQAGMTGCVLKTQKDELTTDIGFSQDTYNEVWYRNIVSQKGQVLDPNSIASDVFSQFYLQGAVGCKYNQEPRKCQIMANLCVLQLYDENSAACNYMEKVLKEASEQDSPLGDVVPKIYYTDSPQTVLKGDPVDLKVAFSVPEGETQNLVSSLTYYLARYTLDGQFEGYQKLDTQLSLCPMSYDAVEETSQFGVTTKMECSLDLSPLLVKNQTTLSNEANAFFELYLQDQDGNLVDVPVVISNYRDKENNMPNQKLNYETSRMTKRFFMIDTISSITVSNGYLSENAKPEYIRLAEQLKLTVQLDPNVQERIRRPLLQITYVEREELQITASPDMKQDVLYFVEYYQEINQYWNFVLGMLIASQVVVIGLVGFKVYIFIKQNPPRSVGQSFASNVIKKLLFTIVDEWSHYMFILSLFVHFWWFVFFKYSEAADILMPTINPTDTDWSAYDVFFIFFIAILACKTLAVILKIVEQTSADIFIMDWEKERYVATEDKEKSVIAWRSTFITNELNELQTEHRNIYPETTLVLFSFIWLGLGWENLTLSNPSLDTAPQEHQPNNMFLKFFLAGFLFIAIAGAQFVFYRVYYTTTSSPLAMFSDMCTVANCSVFMMTNYYHGYYIHGRAPWENSDLPVGWLKIRLDEEVEDKHRSRAIGSDELRNRAQALDSSFNQEVITSFEIYMTDALRNDYNRALSQRIVIEDIDVQAMQQNDQLMSPEKEHLQGKVDKNMKKKQAQTKKAMERDARICAEEKKKSTLNNLLINYFNIVDRQKSNSIVSITPMQRYLKQTPVEFDPKATGDQQKFILVKDQYQNFPTFENVLYSSLDFSMTIVQFCWWFLINDYFKFNAMLSIGIVHLMERFLRWIRATLGQNNLTKKAMVDARFMN